MIEAQGGNEKVIDDMNLLPQAQYQIEVPATKSGYVSAIDADEIGVAAMLLGAGRATKEDIIDLAVGIMLEKKIGDYVEQGQALAILHTNTEQVEESIELVQNHMHISAEKTEAPPLIHSL